MTSNTPVQNLRGSLIKSPGMRGREFFVLEHDDKSDSRQQLERNRDSLRQLIQNGIMKEYNTARRAVEHPGMPNKRQSLQKSQARRSVQPGQGNRRNSLLVQKCRESCRQFMSDTNSSNHEDLQTSIRRLMSTAKPQRKHKEHVIDIGAPPLIESDEESNSINVDGDFHAFEENGKNQRESQTSIGEVSQTEHHSTEPEMIDVAPGVKIPLRHASETWEAIVAGKTITSFCCCCNNELTCIYDAEYLICADCWVFSRIHNSTSRASTNAFPIYYGACIGVTVEDIAKWITANA